MIEQGTVVDVEGDRSVVELKRTARCGHCGVCATIGGGKMHIEVDTVEGVSVGDAVEIEIPVSPYRAILTVLILPLAAVLVGAVLGNVLTRTYFPDTRYPNLPAIVLALVLATLTYLGVYVHERGAGGRQHRPYIRKSG